MHGGSVPWRLRPEDSLLLIIDMQEAFSGVVGGFDSIVGSITLLAKVSKLLGVPVLGTEQVPEKLGGTVREIDALLDEKLAKTTFDALKEERIKERILSSGRRKLLLTGIETHICVLQTTLSALSSGMEVHLVSDATGSTFQEDKQVTLMRLSRDGAHVTTSESVVYELLGSSKHPKFREVVSLVKEYRDRRRREKEE